ncbi:MAG: diguanylate cyclase domain-containing protein, partial [Mariprofundaceae bacterium]
LFIVAYLFIYQHDSYASAINVSGKQRMLSQRIALFANGLVTAKEDSRRRDLLRGLHAALSLFKARHQALLSGDDKLGLPPLNSEGLEKIYFQLPYQLNEKVKQFTVLSEAVLHRAEKGLLTVDMEELVQLTGMAAGGLLQALDIAVWQFQQEADDEIKTRKQMVYGVLIVMLLTLLFGVYEFNVFMKQLNDRNKSLAVSKFVFDHSSDGVITTDGDGIIFTANSPVRDLIGYAPGAIIGRKLESLVTEIALHESVLNEMMDATVRTGEWRGEVLQQMDGSKPLSVGLRAVYKHSEGVATVSNYVMSITDISEQKVSEDQYRFLSLHDKLTGLLNRTALYQEFDSKLAVARREKTEICVLMMDLDGFKQANDEHGHDAGDHVLMMLSERLVEVLRASDTLARFGGDEFIVLAPQSASGGIEPEKIAGKILQAVAEPVLWQGNAISVGISIGIAKYPDAGEELDILIKKADAEMYRVKAGGKNSFSVYMPPVEI